MGENDLKYLKTEFPDKWQFLTKKLHHSYEYFTFIGEYQKPVDNLKKEDFFSKLKNDYPSDKELEIIIKLFNVKREKNYHNYF